MNNKLKNLLRIFNNIYISFLSFKLILFTVIKLVIQKQLVYFFYDYPWLSGNEFK